ncbi:MAG: bifunctional UDP-N-acetylmuramoyl-tripeptide:D-alanyl-D-alanine ligase/alanine racemase, partial [Bacteroidaceae bacterium]|nr:bifunctional UDP-N-acetylmuramoyl-tripeptide:D-alanyl-D-alanine ligase/alanine racemase [Bacteroidaceae bacterium]
MSYTVEQIAEWMGAERIGSASANVNWILTDSRSLCFPEETLFFALKSQRNDGHKYVQELYKRGVRNFVVSRLPQDMVADDCNFFVVDDTLHALQMLAASHRSQFNIPVVGITGSNGKTVVKEWLNQLLSPVKVVTRSPRSYNSQIGVPMSVWLLNEKTEVALFEAGISKINEMEALYKVIKPTIGVLTNIGTAHQENFYSLEEKCMEKLRLFTSSDVIVYNGDDSLISSCVAKSMLSAREIAWSTTDSDKPLFISSIEKKENETHISYRYIGTDGNFTIPFIDDASIENALNCLGVCLYMMIPQDVIVEQMKKLEPVAMRLEVKDGNHGCTLINDSYNSDINSLDIALDFMRRRADVSGRKHTLILSDMLQTGLNAKNLYRKVAQLVNGRGVDKIIGVGDEISSAADRFEMEKYFFHTTADLLESDVFKKLHDEVILVKGSRDYRFEEIIECLEKQFHETILEINLGAVVENLNYYRSFMKPETKMVCMVKASAYGAGSVEVAKTLQDHNVDFLAVAVADEGATLRKAGITSNIMIMNPEMTAFKKMFDYGLEPEVYNFKLLDALIKAAEKEGITNMPIHIKLDTGMHRLGFNPETDVPELINRLKNQNALMPRSIFSHFVGSDDDSFDDFSEYQFNLFDKASKQIQAAFPHKILRHICNSAGIEHFPERHLDMVRLGLGLYGINSRNNKTIHNVSTLKTTLLQIRDVPAGDTVGYSRKGKITRPSRIAAIPIGYADG